MNLLIASKAINTLSRAVTLFFISIFCQANSFCGGRHLIFSKLLSYCIPIVISEPNNIIVINFLHNFSNKQSVRCFVGWYKPCSSNIIPPHLQAISFQTSETPNHNKLFQLNLHKINLNSMYLRHPTLDLDRYSHVQLL